MASILFFLNRKATPSTLPPTASSLKVSILRKIEGRLDLDAHRGEAVTGLGEQLGRVEQRLRGDAADVGAGAAVGGALLDDGDLEAELRGADGADVAAGSGADDDQVVRVGHGGVMNCRLACHLVTPLLVVRSNGAVLNCRGAGGKAGDDVDDSRT